MTLASGAGGPAGAGLIALHLKTGVIDVLVRPMLPSVLAVSFAQFGARFLAYLDFPAQNQGAVCPLAALTPEDI